MNLIILMKTKHLKRGTYMSHLSVRSFSTGFTAFSCACNSFSNFTSTCIILNVTVPQKSVNLFELRHRLSCCVHNLHLGFNIAKAMKCNNEEVQENHFWDIQKLGPSDVLDNIK
jgi:hypothetical protein